MPAGTLKIRGVPPTLWRAISATLEGPGSASALIGAQVVGHAARRFAAPAGMSPCRRTEDSGLQEEGQEGSALHGESSVRGRQVPALLVLELVIAEGEPLNGTVGPASGPRMAFHGWIDLMSAISTLRADTADPAISG